MRSGFLLAALGIAGLCGIARGDNPSLEGPAALANSAERDANSPVLGVSRVEVRYASEAMGRSDVLPSISEVEEATIELGTIARHDGTAYVSSIGRPDLDEGVITRIKLSEIAGLPVHRFTASAIRSISEQITSFMTSRGLAGIYVQPDAADVTAAENAAAASGQAPVALHFVIHVAAVSQVRTVEVGNHAPPKDSLGYDKINNDADQSIVEHSPVQAGPDEVLRKDDLDDYVLWLNRQPGRRVDVAIDSAEGSDSVSLDYLIAREKPWQIYTQISNTGTRETNQWRETVGLIDNQLTGHDDSLSIDYTTAGFSDQNSVDVSYESPLFDLPRTRGRVYGSYDSFDSSDVGDSLVHFTGNTALIGGEVSQNIYQHHQLFLDLLAGLRIEGIHVDDSTTGTGGTGDFLLPYVGLHLDRTTAITSIIEDVTLLGSFTDSSQSARDGLGRIGSDQDAVILQGDYLMSFYLEPLLSPRDFDRQQSTLANEVAFSVKGQYAFDNRLIAEEEYVAGGLYTVRGYPESLTAGDSAAIVSMEYRFHLPRALGVSREPGRLFGDQFRWAPQQPYGRPDWDLIFRGFVDAGAVYNSRRESFENNASLVGIGVGVELQFKENADLRLDFGRALKGVTDTQTGATLVSPGSTRLSMVFTLKI